MIIHSRLKIKKERGNRKKLRGKHRLRTVLIISLSINTFFMFAGIFGSGYAIRRAIKKGKFQKSIQKASDKFRRQYLGFLYNLRSSIAPASPKTFIDINFKNYKKLSDKRDESLRLGWIVASNEDFVPASIRHEDKVVPVRIRLKGDLVEHVDGEKWSLRIRTRGDARYKGMSRFTIQDPKLRTYANEFAYLYHLRIEGILAPRYEFIDVVINGKNKGIYALEESFAKEFIESQGRREGVVVKFNEDSYWDQIINWPDNSDRSYLPHKPSYFHLMQRTWLNVDLDVWNKGYIEKRPYLQKQRDIALGLLSSFISGEKKASEVFDVDQLARFFAITYLWGGDHAFGWQNINFYYNPITSRLEPIGFDSMSGGRMNEQTYGEIARGKRYPNYPWGYFDWVLVALQDKKVAKKYIKECERISDPKYFEWLKENLKEPLNRQFRVLWKEKPETIEWEAIEFNRNFLQSVINPTNQIEVYIDSLEVKSIDTERVAQFSIRNLLSLPVELVSVKIGSETIPLKNKVILDGIDYIRSPIEREVFNLRIPLPMNYFNGNLLKENLKIEVYSRLLGGSKDLAAEAIAYPRPKFVENIPISPSVSKFLEIFEFTYYDKKSNSIIIRSGSWNIQQSMIIPESVTLIVEPGTVLKFNQGTFLLAREAVNFTGTEKKRIILCANRDNWAGMAILGKGGRSILKNVTIKECSGIKNNDWVLTGGLTFFNSRVSLENVKVKNAFCEDAINAIQSRVLINNSTIQDSTSDALDCDYCQGEITNSLFLNIKGDAVDVSGTVLEVKDSKMINVGDKGLSVGERSKVTAQRITIEGANIAIASKDMSEINIDDSSITNSYYGLAAYQKKPEYGPAIINASNLRFNEVKKPILLQNSSNIILDGQKQQGEEVDVSKLYL
ncbi:CotH kinase family protein [Candidatus Omnitrophota bacterium]